MRQLIPAVALAVTVAACGDSSPTTPTPAASSVAITSASPVSGSVVVVPERFPYGLPGGVVLPPGSGVLSVGVALTSSQDVPWAQLNVYLLTGDSGSEYCGQNLPDSPTWRSLRPGWTTAVTVTGFQIYRLPCEVTGVRAMLHTRNGNLAAPPRAGETLAEATLQTRFQIRRAD